MTRAGWILRSLRRFEDWLTRDRLNFFFTGLAAAQFALFLWLESTGGVLDRQERVRGRDFLHFYIGGRIVARGEVDRLYDQQYFQQVQRSIAEIDEKRPPYFSVYPPTVSLLASAPGRLPYGEAVCVWWVAQAMCFFAAGCLLVQELRPPPAWRYTAWAGLAAFYPVINTFWNGQLAALLLVGFLVGLWLHGRGRPVAAGCVLSLLAFKPQLAVGVVGWLVLRRDARALSGFSLGLLAQAGVVVAVLGPDVLPDYARNTRLFPALFRLHQNTPDHQHALGGIVIDLFGGEFSGWGLLGQAIVATVAALLLLGVVGPGRRAVGRVEASAAVVFTLLATPHLLTYDLSYLLIPVAYLLSAYRMTRDPGFLTPAVWLYLAATMASLYWFVGVSLIPVVLLLVLGSLRRLPVVEREAVPPAVRGECP
jgi:hypothetical protein